MPFQLIDSFLDFSPCSVKSSCTWLFFVFLNSLKIKRTGKNNKNDVS